MVHWAQMHVLQIDLACLFEHFGGPQLTKPDSEKQDKKQTSNGTIWHE